MCVGTRAYVRNFCLILIKIIIRQQILSITPNFKFCENLSVFPDIVVMQTDRVAICRLNCFWRGKFL